MIHLFESSMYSEKKTMKLRLSLMKGLRGDHFRINTCLSSIPPGPEWQSLQFSSVQSLSRVQLFVTPWIAACQASLSITNSWSSLKLMSIKSVMPSSHLILCRPPLLLPPIPPSVRVFSSESALHMRWPKYWSFSFSIIPSKEIPGLISFRMDWLDLLAVHGTLRSLLDISKTSNQAFTNKEALFVMWGFALFSVVIYD